MRKLETGQTPGVADLTRRNFAASSGLAKVCVCVEEFDSSEAPKIHFPFSMSQYSRLASRSHDSGCLGSSTNVMPVTRSWVRNVVKIMAMGPDQPDSTM